MVGVKVNFIITQVSKDPGEFELRSSSFAQSFLKGLELLRGH
jgi:hypothetical protein